MVHWDILVPVEIGLLTVAVIVINFTQEHLMDLNHKLRIIHVPCLALSRAKSLLQLLISGYCWEMLNITHFCIFRATNHLVHVEFCSGSIMNDESQKKL